MTQTNGKIHHAHGLEELLLLKWLYAPKQFIFSAFPMHNTNGIFFLVTKMKEIISKVCMETEKVLNSQINPEPGE